MTITIKNEQGGFEEGTTMSVDILPDCMMPDGGDPCKAFQKMHADYQKLEQDNKTLRAAIAWALGYTNFPQRQDGEGPYWWRSELRALCGETFNGCDFIDPLNPGIGCLPTPPEGKE